MPWELGGGGPSLRASSLTLEAPGLHDTNLYGGGGCKWDVLTICIGWYIIYCSW